MKSILKSGTHPPFDSNRRYIKLASASVFKFLCSLLGHSSAALCTVSYRTNVVRCVVLCGSRFLSLFL